MYRSTKKLQKGPGAKSNAKGKRNGQGRAGAASPQADRSFAAIKAVLGLARPYLPFQAHGAPGQPKPRVSAQHRHQPPALADASDHRRHPGHGPQPRQLPRLRASRPACPRCQNPRTGGAARVCPRGKLPEAPS